MPEGIEDKTIVEKPKPGISAVKIILIVVVIAMILIVGIFIYMGLIYSSAVSEFTEKSEMADETINSVASSLGKKIVIEGARCTVGEPGTLTIYIRNIGTSNIEASELEAFLDNVKIPVEFGSLSPGLLKMASISRSIKTGNYSLVVVSPAGDNVKTVSCV